MKLDYTLPGVMTQSSGLDTPTTNFLPQRVVDVPKDVMRSFPHSKRVGNYLLGKTLGEGSFAKVKEALHTLTGEKVAVKVIDKKKAKEDVYVRKNLRREGKLLQIVRHRHVIQLLEIMETENSYYLVTELCQGGDLMDLICSNKRLDETQTRKYIKQISSAVDYLHKAGILHRDLKVENLLLDHNKDIKIIDFGLSNSVRVSHTKEGGSQAQEYCVTQCGSPAYAAPELLGNKKYGPKVDIWSIGVNMYAMLTGNLPFTVEPFNIKALHNKMLKGEINAIPETLSPECVDLLKSFLTADPESRISLERVMKHTWITDGNNKPMEPAPFPNRLSSDYLDHDIIKHMASNMDYRMSDVIRLATNNVPNNATATYHLLLKKLTRYNEEVKAKGRSSSESRYTTPDSSKQAFRSGRRSATGDMIRLTPVDKSHPRPPRRAISQDYLRRQRTNTVDTQKTQKSKDSAPEDSSDTEKTLVRRKIHNARVLHRINGPPDKKSPRKEKMVTETALKNEHLPIKGSDIREEDEDEQDENIEALEDEEDDDDDEENEEDVSAEDETTTSKALKGTKSPRLQRRYTDKLQVQEVITTALTPRSVHPAETVTTRLIGLPHIDKSEKSKPTAILRTSENGTISPRGMPRKVYPSFGYISKTKATAASSPHQQGIVRYSQKSSGEHSSNSTTSSRDGQKSTCSNPNPSTQHFAQTAENKGSVSDPSTKTEFKSITTARPAAAKTVNIEIDSCDKYTRNSLTGADVPHRPLPTVSPPRTLGGQNRRVVNIVYPPFNKARGLSMRQQVTGRQAVSCDFENTLNITGEKALLGDTSHVLESGKTNMDCIPLKARLTRVEATNRTPEQASLSSDNSHKIVLPSLPLVETKAVNIT